MRTLILLLGLFGVPCLGTLSFEKPLYEASVLEGPITGADLITVAAAGSEEDEGTVRYSLSSLVDSRSQEFFAIDEKRGAVTVVAPLDRLVRGF